MRVTALLRWLGELLNDLRYPDWWQRRAVRRDLDRRLAAWRALPDEERRKWVHPTSRSKPEGWSAEGYRETRGRRHDA